MDGGGGMPGMAMSPSPPSPMSHNATGMGGGGEGMHGGMHKMMMHMTFFWGKDAEVLFSGFPGTRGVGLYVLCLVFVFAMALLVEALSSATRRLGATSRPGCAAGIGPTAVHTVRVGLAYLVMLATMSFNGGVLLAAVAGHAVGFFVFGSSAFRWGGGGAAGAQATEKC